MLKCCQCNVQCVFTDQKNMFHTCSVFLKTWLDIKLGNVAGLYLVCQFSEVLLCVANHVSHSEDGAVGVVDHVKVTAFDVIASDCWKEIPSAHTCQHVSISDFSISVIFISIIMLERIWKWILSVIEGWEADAVLDKNGEILHFHHGRTEREEKRGKQRMFIHFQACFLLRFRVCWAVGAIVDDKEKLSVTFTASSYVLMVSISAGHHPFISHFLIVALKGTHFPVRIPEDQKNSFQTNWRTNKYYWGCS